MPIKGRIFAILGSYYDDYDDHYEVPRLNWELIRKPYSVELSPSNITDEEFEISEPEIELHLQEQPTA